ncbi:hypothetical protein [Paraflavitalea speifideaquila]|uniref:hypothetical protein n=1 Tax=Paraflavitalea speifideaquila TaxID=3076558 RepID=UPI0028E53F49|nr:hypothetical protein [Paraflavitalea speifideiaquila]
MNEANLLAILLVEKYPDVVDYKHFLGIIYSGLYLLYRFCGQRDSSVYCCRKAYGIFQELAIMMPDNEEYKKALEYYPVMLDYLLSNDYENE